MTSARPVKISNLRLINKYSSRIIKTLSSGRDRSHDPHRLPMVGSGRLYIQKLGKKRSLGEIFDIVLTTPIILRFDIPGAPVGAVRQTRRDSFKPSAAVERYRDWRDLARRHFRDARHCAIIQTPGFDYRKKDPQRFDYTRAPDEVHLVAYFDLPRERSNVRNLELLPEAAHREKPDGDNVLKALVDALFVEDKGIYNMSIIKKWAREGGARLEVVLIWVK